MVNDPQGRSSVEAIAFWVKALARARLAGDEMSLDAVTTGLLRRGCYFKMGFGSNGGVPQSAGSQERLASVGHDNRLGLGDVIGRAKRLMKFTCFAGVWGELFMRTLHETEKIFGRRRWVMPGARVAASAILTVCDRPGAGKFARLKVRQVETSLNRCAPGQRWPGGDPTVDHRAIGL